MYKIIFTLLLLIVIPFSHAEAQDNSAVTDFVNSYIGFTVGAPIIKLESKGIWGQSLRRTKLVNFNFSTGMCLVEHPITNKDVQKNRFWVHYTKITFPEKKVLIKSF